MKKSGISLVALVITIIVLIILTGAVIVTFMEGGIIDRAKESVFKSDMRTYQEILALKRAENQMEVALGEKEPQKINASDLEDIQEIIPEFKEEYEGLVVITDGELTLGEKVTGEELSSTEELYSTWLSDLGIGLSRLPKNAFAKVEGLEVGDYVVYNPDGTIPSNLPLSLTRQNINWRVLKNDGRQVTLISETPIDSISFNNGTDAFLNGPSKLDTTYAGLYSGSKGTARNLKIEDVNEAMGIVIGEDVKPSYGITSDQGPSYFELDAGATFGDAIDGAQVDISSYTMPDDNYRDYPLGYMYNGSTYKAGHETEYSILFPNGVVQTGDIYLLSSQSVQAIFGVYGNVSFSLYGIQADIILPGSTSGAGRPVVILNTDVEAVDAEAGGDTVATAWQIK